VEPPNPAEPKESNVPHQHTDSGGIGCAHGTGSGISVPLEALEKRNGRVLDEFLLRVTVCRGRRAHGVASRAGSPGSGDQRPPLTPRPGYRKLRVRERPLDHPRVRRFGYSLATGPHGTDYLMVRTVVARHRRPRLRRTHTPISAGARSTAATVGPLAAGSGAIASARLAPALTLAANTLRKRRSAPLGPDRAVLCALPSQHGAARMRCDTGSASVNSVSNGRLERLAIRQPSRGDVHDRQSPMRYFPRRGVRG
jgi:hypothetical protein